MTEPQEGKRDTEPDTTADTTSTPGTPPEEPAPPTPGWDTTAGTAADTEGQAGGTAQREDPNPDDSE